jgi:hypothetical protein
MVAGLAGQEVPEKKQSTLIAQLSGPHAPKDTPEATLTVSFTHGCTWITPP